MSGQPRVVKVLTALLVSMTVGATVLMALGSDHPKDGPFSLSSYYLLDPIKDAAKSSASQVPGRWDRLEIYYSGTGAGNIEQLASICGLSSPEDLNSHFVVCNGTGGADGQIQTTARWTRQWSPVPNMTWHGSGGTIRICVIADERLVRPSNYQRKRTEMLVEHLRHKFGIEPTNIYYPDDWHH